MKSGKYDFYMIASSGMSDMCSTDLSDFRHFVIAMPEVGSLHGVQTRWRENTLHPHNSTWDATFILDEPPSPGGAAGMRCFRTSFWTGEKS
jgi:hypothetical protein